MSSSVFSYLFFHFSNWQFEGSLLLSIYQWLVTRVANVFFQWESAIFITESFCILMKSNLPNFSFGNSGFSVFLMKVYTYPLVYKYFYKFICKIRSCNMWGYVVAFLPGQEGGALHASPKFPVSPVGRSWALSPTSAVNESPSLWVAQEYATLRTGFALGAISSVHSPLGLSTT